MGHYDRPVVDQTGLDGAFDFVLEWGPDLAVGSTESPIQDDLQSNLQEALKDQLGLKLERKDAALSVLLIDHVERLPTEN
jgi:uncharacterized protein (TIGR03435 family)